MTETQTGKNTEIDILVVYGGHGGFENALQMTTHYLQQHGCRIRYVQALEASTGWIPDEAERVVLGLQADTFTFEEAGEKYAQLLAAGDVPALILATGWPYTVYIAKAATSQSQTAVPVCAWLHGDIRFYEESGSGGLDILQNADMSLAISNRIADDIYTAYPDSVVYRLNNAIDLSRLRYSEKRNTLKLAFVGRLAQEKALAVLFYALELTLLPWELYIVGIGDEEKELRKLAKKLNIAKRIHFLGWREKPWEHLEECRALVMTSLYEGASLSILEALACGMQVVSTPAGVATEVIKEGETGFIYPFADPKALATALDHMGQKKFLPDLAKECRDSVNDYLPQSAMWDTLCKIIACARRICLPQRYTPDNARLYVQDKVSVLLHADRFAPESLREALEKLKSQTIEACYMEIAAVTSAAGREITKILEDAERSDPERILVIQAEDTGAQDDVMQIAEQYLSGRFCYILKPEQVEDFMPDSVESWYMDRICSEEYHLR